MCRATKGANLIAEKLVPAPNAALLEKLNTLVEVPVPSISISRFFFLYMSRLIFYSLSLFCISSLCSISLCLSLFPLFLYMYLSSISLSLSLDMYIISRACVD